MSQISIEVKILEGVQISKMQFLSSKCARKLSAYADVQVDVCNNEYVQREQHSASATGSATKSKFLTV